MATVILENSTGIWNGTLSTCCALLDVAQRYGWKPAATVGPYWIMNEYGDFDDWPRVSHTYSSNDAQDIFEAVASACRRASELPTDECERLVEVAEFCGTGEFKLLLGAEPTLDPDPTPTADSRNLKTVGGVIGFVDGVNGRGASEILDFVPTKHEVVVFGKRYLRNLLDDRYYEHIFGELETREIYRIKFAYRWISFIEDLLERLMRSTVRA